MKTTVQLYVNTIHLGRVLLAKVTLIASIVIISTLVCAQPVQLDLQPSPTQFLTGEQKTAILQLINYTVQSVRGIGNAEVDSYSVHQFVHAMVDFSRSQDIPALKQIKSLDFGPLSAVQSFLLENGLIPELAYAIEYIVDTENEFTQRDVDLHVAWRISDYFAYTESLKFKKISKIKTAMLENSYKSPDQFSLTFEQQDSDMRMAFFTFAQAQAFDLNNEGRPRSIDPQLANLIIRLRGAKENILAVGKSAPVGFWSKVSEYFYSLNGSFQFLWDGTLEIESGIYDLQGAIDTVKYKMAHQETDSQGEFKRLQLVLDDLYKKKNKFVELADVFLVQAENLAGTTLVSAYRQLDSHLREITAYRMRLVSHFERIIRRTDEILKLHMNDSTRLKIDTPWELAVQDVGAQARLMGLLTLWDDIRTFSIIVKETYETAHWTTEEEVEYTNSDGTKSSRTETRHHYSSSTDYDRETVQTPTVELQFAEKICGFEQRMRLLMKQRSDSAPGVVDELMAQIQDDKSMHADLLKEPPSGKDESEHKVPRLMNQQDQFRALIERCMILEVSIENNLELFNRGYSNSPDEVKGIVEALKVKDSLQNSRMLKGAIAIGATAAAGAGACAYVSSGGLQ